MKNHERELQTGRATGRLPRPSLLSAGVRCGLSDDESVDAALRLRSLRSLYDPAYVDESWIGQPVRLIPRMKAWIAARCPGVKIAITEYNWGDDQGALEHARASGGARHLRARRGGSAPDALGRAGSRRRRCSRPTGSISTTTGSAAALCGESVRATEHERGRCGRVRDPDGRGGPRALALQQGDVGAHDKRHRCRRRNGAGEALPVRFRNGAGSRGAIRGHRQRVLRSICRHDPQHSSSLQRAVLSAEAPPAPRGLAAAPTPFRSAVTVRFDLPSPASVSVDVCDAAGRVVRRLSARALEAGPNSVIWDGRDGDGRELAAGVYFVRVASGAETRSVRVVRVE